MENRSEAKFKKVVIHRYGGHEVLEVEDYPSLPLKVGEVRVKVKNFGVNYADICIRWGLYESAKKFVGLPITPGFEASGVVSEIGPGVSRYQVGDRVIAVVLFNAYASEVVASEDFIFPMPSNVTFEQASSLAVIFMTAYHGLFQNIVVRPKMKVLVHSAAGGVGSALIQLGRLAGLEMAGVVGSPHKVPYVQSIGASLVIDKSTGNLWAQAKKWAPEGFDIIFDANGVETLGQSYKHLAPAGKLVCYGFHTMFKKGSAKVSWGKLIFDFLRTPRFGPLDMTNQNKSLVTFNLSFLFPRKDLLQEGMREILKWIEEEKIVPPPITIFKISEMAKAHELIETGQSIGKIVIATDCWPEIH